MLEFNNSTLANMTAALELGCKHLSGKFDTAQNRKRIGDAIVDAARSGKRTLAQFVDVALHEVVTIKDPKPSPIQAVLDWLRRRIKRAESAGASRYILRLFIAHRDKSDTSR